MGGLDGPPKPPRRSERPGEAGALLGALLQMLYPATGWPSISMKTRD
jgi:hypothetical protein